MDLNANVRAYSRVRTATVAIAGVLLLAALILRWSNLTQAARQEAFATSVAKAVAGNASRVPEAVDSSVDQAETERLEGILALKRGDTAEADLLFERAMEASASMVPLVRWARPKDEALARFAYGLYPSAPDSPAWLANILSPKEPEESLKLFQEAAALDPLNNTLWEQTGTLAHTLKHDDIALPAFGKACAIYPSRFGTCVKAAELSYNAGLWDQTIKYFQLASMPNNSADWVLLIKAAQKLGHTADADSYLAQAKVAAPDDYTKLLARQP